MVDTGGLKRKGLEVGGSQLVNRLQLSSTSLTPTNSFTTACTPFSNDLVTDKGGIDHVELIILMRPVRQ